MYAEYAFCEKKIKIKHAIYKKKSQARRQGNVVGLPLRVPCFATMHQL